MRPLACALRLHFCSCVCSAATLALLDAIETSSVNCSFAELKAQSLSCMCQMLFQLL